MGSELARERTKLKISRQELSEFTYQLSTLVGCQVVLRSIEYQQYQGFSFKLNGGGVTFLLVIPVSSDQPTNRELRCRCRDGFTCHSFQNSLLKTI